MKTLIAALTFATLIAAPALVQSANAAPPSDRGDAAGQTSGGTYQGYPLREWYRPDGW
jgi:hypothetical protein